LLVVFSPGNAETYTVWGGNWTVIWWQVVSGIFVQKIVKIW